MAMKLILINLLASFALILAGCSAPDERPGMNSQSGADRPDTTAIPRTNANLNTETAARPEPGNGIFRGPFEDLIVDGHFGDDMRFTSSKHFLSREDVPVSHTYVYDASEAQSIDRFLKEVRSDAKALISHDKSVKNRNILLLSTTDEKKKVVYELYVYGENSASLDLYSCTDLITLQAFEKWLRPS
jgi:uncharacterized protein YcfL